MVVAVVDLTTPNKHREWNSTFLKSIVCPLVSMNRIVKVSGIVRFLTYQKLRTSGQDTVELTSDEVRTMTVETLIDHFSMVVDGHKYKTEDIWNVTVAASAQRQAIESVANQLVDAPAPSTVRYYLRNELVNLMTLTEIENDCNEALVDHLPPGICGGWHKVAMDLTCIPYHGEAGAL